MKKTYFFIVLVFLFSCSSPSSKIIGKWDAIGLGDSDGKMLLQSYENQDVTMEFNKDGNAFFTYGPNTTPCKWELSENKIALTSQNLPSLTIEVIENKLLIVMIPGKSVPTYYLKDDNLSSDNFKAVVRRNVEKSQYLQQIPKDYYQKK